MEQDYEIGSTIREVIPHAVSWFAKSVPTSATSLLGNAPIRISNLASGGILNDQAVLLSAFIFVYFIPIIYGCWIWRFLHQHRLLSISAGLVIHQSHHLCCIPKLRSTAIHPE